MGMIKPRSCSKLNHQYEHTLSLNCCENIAMKFIRDVMVILMSLFIKMNRNKGSKQFRKYF